MPLRKNSAVANQTATFSQMVDDIKQTLAKHRTKPSAKLSALEFVKEEIVSKHYPELLEQYRESRSSKPAAKNKRRSAKKPELVREIYGGLVYEYYPLGEYIVAAPGVCGGRPTIKYHRLDARWVIGYLRSGETPEELAHTFKIPVEAVHEAVKLAKVYDYEKSYA